jgi:hypothetical protein
VSAGIIICLTLCGDCQFLEEHPNVPHTWGGVDDFAHAWATWQDAPGFCGCECGRPARDEKDRYVARPDPVALARLAKALAEHRAEENPTVVREGEADA